MIQINCDIGERGPLHEDDRRLMEFVHIANLACAGHAGDRESVKAFLTLAKERGVGISAHLSYPDKANFGRASMDLPEAGLLAALDEQLALLPGVRLVKFHGALYNDACRDARLAELLAGWLMRNNIGSLLAPADSELAAAAQRLGITVLREAFVDRRYSWDAATGRELIRLVALRNGWFSLHFDKSGKPPRFRAFGEGYRLLRYRDRNEKPAPAPWIPREWMAQDLIKELSLEDSPAH